MADTISFVLNGLGQAITDLQEKNAVLQEQIQHLTDVVMAARSYRDAPKESQRAARNALFAALDKRDG